MTGFYFKRIFFLLAFALGMISCSGGTDGDNQNLPPQITSLSPNSMLRHMPAFTLRVLGANFVANSRIVFNQAEKATTFINSSELNCQVEAAETLGLAAKASMDSPSAAVGDQSVPVLVRNPQGEGGDSGTVFFTFRANPAFANPKEISNTPGACFDPEIVAETAGNLYAAWENYNPGIADIFFCRSIDHGASWSSALNLSNNPVDSRHANLAVGGNGRVFFLYGDDTPGYRDIYFRRSPDRGLSWGSKINISRSKGSSWWPDMAADGSGNVYIIWEENANIEIDFSRSQDDGDSWSPPLNLSRHGGAGLVVMPSIALDGSGRLFAVWAGVGAWSGTVYFSRSSNQGSTWTLPIALASNAKESKRPRVAVDMWGGVYVAWCGERAAYTDIYFRRSTDRGAHWDAAVNITNDARDLVDPVIAVDVLGNINVAWGEETPNTTWQIYFTRSTDKGATWSASSAVITSFCQSPALAADADCQLHLLFRAGGDILYASTR